MSEAVETHSAQMAVPICDVGSVVQYKDRQGRHQTGKVFNIDAHWTEAGKPPVVIYRVWHPTYPLRSFVCTDENILEVMR